MSQRYAQVDEIVEGALNRSETVTNDTDLKRLLDLIETEAHADGLETEVYVLWHEHPLSELECSCAQYVTDHHPAYTYNVAD